MILFICYLLIVLLLNIIPDPPENVTINSTSSSNHQLDHHIRVIENIKLSIFCSALANPAPNNYSWSGLANSFTNELQILVNSSTIGSQNVTCFMTNTMREFPNNSTTFGRNNKTYILEILRK